MKASFTPAASPQPASRRSRGRIVTYAEAREHGEAELWDRMEKLIERIDRNPESFEAVEGFGGGPLAQFENWARDLDKFFAGLPQGGPLSRDQKLQVEKMGLARVEITRDIAVHLGAVPEVLRRYDSEYIPQAKVCFDQSGDPEDELALNDTCRRKGNFMSRHALLETARATSVITAQFLREVMEAPDLKWAHSHYLQSVRPGLDRLRQQREAGLDMPLTAAQAAAARGHITILKPLRFKQPAGRPLEGL